MRKQRVVLEYIANAPLARRHVDAAIRVEPRLAVDDDAAFVGSHETRQHLQRQRLAGARWTVEREARGVGGKTDREIEPPARGPDLLFDIDVDVHRYTGATRMCPRRANIFAAMSSVTQTSETMITSAPASASSPAFTAS